MGTDTRALAELAAQVADLSARLDELAGHVDRISKVDAILARAEFGVPVRRPERPNHLRLAWSRPERRLPAS